jgi:signal transduction histidine kinase
MNAIAQPQPDSSEAPDPAVLLAAVQAFPESLAIVASGIMVYANPAWCEMFECPDPLQRRSREIQEAVSSHSLSIVPEAVPLDLRNDRQETGSELYFVHTRQDGTYLYLEEARTEFHLLGSDFQMIHTRDVSRLKLVEKQLREAQRMEAVGRLVGGVAHDFNNLLTGVMLYCDLLIGGLEEDSRLHRHAQEMRTACEHGAALVQQLLSVARPCAGESRVLSLNDVVNSVEDLLRRLIGENIVLSTSLAADLDAVRMDPAQIQQILLNLVLNARDAMSDGGRITLTTRNCSDGLPIGAECDAEWQLPLAPWVELAVADTGCGMDAETLLRAFEPFFTTKKPGRGNGLGLATARRLAEQEGGIVIAESEPGKGTQVSLRLPRAQPTTPTNSKAKEVIS